MSLPSEKRTELLVGLFVFFGLAIMAVLILQFGSFGDRIRESYPLHVKFKDASGIRDGIDVRTGGVKVGNVKGQPQADSSLESVLVDLSIFSEYRIPNNSVIRIRSSGLMGDNFISIKLDENPSTDYFDSTVVIAGESAGDLSELTDTAEKLSVQADKLLAELTDTLAEVRHGLEDLNSALDKFDNDILGSENIENVKEAIASFRELSDNLNEASNKLGPVADEVTGAVHNANGAFEGAQEIVLQLQPVIDDLEKAADAVNDGDGLLGALLNDPALRKDFIALIANLKEHGVLRYKDTATGDRSAAGSSATPAPTPKAAAPEKKGWRPFNRSR
jgi:phospholipid/cholesterol/gamma-HCH transport system substrate-binding protein